MATLMQPDGKVELVFPSDHKKFTLDEVRTLVGAPNGMCWVEKVDLPKGAEWDGYKPKFMLVDEEGLLKRDVLEPNINAMNIDGDRRLIVGNALLVYGGEF